MAELHANPSPNLLDQVSDWGVTVSEAKPRRNFGAIIFLISAYALLTIGSLYILPILAGLLLSADSNGIASEATVVAAIICLGIFLKVRSGKLPRNALQIDHDAAQIRFGHQTPDGVFIRQRVASLRDIGEVSVDQGNPPALCLEIGGDLVTMHFNDADTDSLGELATQIVDARDIALRAPIRSRIRSRVTGIGANFREVQSRIQSRIGTI